MIPNIPKIIEIYILKPLEFLSHYGFIDIIFGLGIVGLLVRFFKNRTVKEIIGVELYTRFYHNPAAEITYKSRLNIHIDNKSSNFLYVYRVLFRSSKYFPRINCRAGKNLTGWYVPLPSVPEKSIPQSLRAGESLVLWLPFAEDYSHREGQEKLNILKDRKLCGVLKIDCICGAEQKFVKAKI